MKPVEPPFSANDYLDQRKEALTQKHQRRLQRMTQEALQSRHSLWHQDWFKPAMVAAFSVLLVGTAIFLKPSENPVQKEGFPNAFSSQTLPEWVMDTDVPLTLIENLEFYDWLAQQPKEKQAKFQKSITLAVNEFHQYRFSQRRTSENTTQGVVGTINDFRTIQR